jgi:hypothetical protein
VNQNENENENQNENQNENENENQNENENGNENENENQNENGKIPIHRHPAGGRAGPPGRLFSPFFKFPPLFLRPSAAVREVTMKPGCPD